MTGGIEDVGIERIDDRDAMAEIIETTTASAHRELCSTLPSGPYPLSMLRSSWDIDLAMIGRGISIPVVYQSDAARPPDVLRYLAEFAAAGAKVRINPRVTHRMMIVDRTTVLVAVQQDSLGVPFLVVREPVLVRNFCLQFAALWRQSHSVGFGEKDALSELTVRETLEVLSSGATEDAAARKLGISTRTFRRRVAAVMDLLGATSRFEAGVKAADAGWL